MAEKNANKATAWRLTEETRDRLAEVSKQFSSKEAAMNAMLTALELSGQAESIPGRSKTIEDFQALTSRIVEMYVESLKNTTDAETRIREELKARIETDGRTIAKLQAGIKEAVGKQTRAEAEAEDLTLTLEKRTRETAEHEEDAVKARLEVQDVRRALEDKQTLLELAQHDADQYKEDAALKENAVKSRNEVLEQSKANLNRALDAEEQLESLKKAMAETITTRQEAESTAESLRKSLKNAQEAAREEKHKAREQMEAEREKSAEKLYQAREDAQNQTAAIYAQLSTLQEKYSESTQRAADAEKAQSIVETDLSSALETVADLRRQLEKSQKEAKDVSDKFTALLTKRAEEKDEK